MQMTGGGGGGSSDLMMQQQDGQGSGGVLSQDQMGQQMIDQVPGEYIYAEMFRCFEEVENNGNIGAEDLEVAAKAMGWHGGQGKYFKTIN